MMGASVECNACGSRMRPWLTMPLDPKKNEPTPFSSVVRCEDCGIGVLNPLPSETDIPRFYDLEAYYTHGESHMKDVPPSFADKLLTKLAWWADHSTPFDVSRVARNLPPDARICDLGCGHALYLREFKARGFDVVGIEPDAHAREQAKDAGVLVLEGTAEDIPLGLGKFDLVLCTHALEHCRDPLKAIENALSLTKPGGCAYIEVPNCSAAHFKTFTVCSEMFDAPRHIYFFTPEGLSRLAERVGFRVKERLFSGYVRDFSPGWRAWETSIADRIGGKRHTFLASLGLFLRSFWRTREHKYDCVGLMLTRAS